MVLCTQVIVDAVHWRAHLPDVIEAVFNDRETHSAFLQAYGLTSESHPFVTLNFDDWSAPFS